MRLNELLDLPRDVYGITNNKSSSGRINLQTRLIVNGVPAFDYVPRGYRGELWLEVTTCLERTERGFRVRRPDARVAPVFHLEPLDGELDIDQPAAPELQIVPAASFAGELSLHAHTEVVHLRGRRCGRKRRLHRRRR